MSEWHEVCRCGLPKWRHIKRSDGTEDVKLYCSLRFDSEYQREGLG